MGSPTFRSPSQRARRRAVLFTVTSFAVLSLTVTALPATAAPPGPEPGVDSVWGKKATPFVSPPVAVGTTKPVPTEPEAAPSQEVATWRASERKRSGATSGSTQSPRVGASTPFDPEGQGAVPWHRISDFRITDSLVARINLSNGNLMLAGTDFDIAGVGQKLRLTRTYNSLDAPWGKVSQRWWQGYERYLKISTGSVVLYDATGDTVRFSPGSGGNFTTPTGYSKDLKANADGTYTLTDRKSGVKDTYDQHGTLTKVTDRNKGTISVTQHNQGTEHKGFKLTETRSGRWVDLVKTYPNQWQAKDNVGRTAVFDLNPAGDLAKTTDTEGKATLFDYDPSRRLTKITTPQGRVTVFTYDSVNRVTSMLRATAFNGSGHTGPTYNYAYSAADPQAAGTTTVTNPEQHATRYEHHADGAVTKVTDALGRDRSTTFDANRNVATATDAMGVGGGAGNVTAYGWDGRNNPTSAKLPTGATASMTGYQTIAGADLPGSMTTADDEKTDYAYDAAGNTTTVAVTGTGGGTRTFDHNPAAPTCGGFEGQRCKATTRMTATKTVSTAFRYDGQGNLEKVTPPTPLGPTTYTYDALGRPLTVTDGRGITTTYTYDHRDRTKTVTTPTASVRYEYDGDGNLTLRSDGTGAIRYEFDPLSRETIRTLQNGSQTQLTYTPAGNVDTYTDPSGVTDYTWNAVNKLTQLKEPTANRTTTYEYNRNDTRTKTTYPGGTVQNVTLDSSGRPEKIKATSSQGTLTELDYSYRNGTKDSSKIRTATDAVAGRKTTYSYDGEGRLAYAKEEQGSTLSAAWQYCYDRAGNLTSQGTVSGCPAATTYTINDAQQITAKNGSTTNWSHDAAGNETAAASSTDGTRTAGQWSDYAQLTSLTIGATTYTGQYGSTDQSERIRLGDTFFHNGPLGLSATSTAGVDRGFNREPGGTLNSMTTGGRSYYYLTDAIGSVVALADDTGTKVNTYAYEPRGVKRSTTTETVPQPYRFAAGYQDPTGLYHYAARYYDPHTSRFTSPDPSGQEKNPYLYAEGDPVNRIDPTGLISIGGALEGLGKSSDLINTGIAAIQGDTRAAWASVAGWAVGTLAGVGCGALTAGTGVGAAVAPAVCAGVGFYTGEIVSGAIKG
ncbi:RHS repeat-associated core domain-containing protein [Streptomyces sp. NBC_00690]|uniref:RHS repeat-associated core domain-containing protein n=1 Tax=Streptomyces sp. NBC_00690 TaxID=2975808 RepID=UPI002E2E6947|nr:RHS repeat-associated core domain-containing protein [Streptomyces sp. NBC_00690]